MTLGLNFGVGLALVGLGDLHVLSLSGLGLVLVVLGGLILFTAMGGLRWLVDRLPMSEGRRRTLIRLRPVLEVVVATTYLLLALPAVLDDHLEFTPVSLGLMALTFGLIGVSWATLRDLVNGVFIKAGELCREGDRVIVSGRVGVVRHLGHRFLTLESESGEEVFIPYGQLSRESIVRTQARAGSHRHSFELALPASLEPSPALRALSQAALASHWSSLVRPPELEALGGGRVRVHVYALGREQGVVIEAAVRELAASLEAQPADASSPARAKPAAFAPPRPGFRLD
ncbi:hypothetical protein PPSIR1_34722 [Plesiocystis pacifica SIR-1]|uniref:Mechanosensitive ion channel MscS domain-containing protein n=1 Tax=Plesiocystis pacifica SIR-1 TaxID=391625 RepID=A6GE85_9BACT|nr:mechanosensitive ion channel domain-containing protein [Plesiocystis pacifica]EDM75803.1 hypothetical protein PPSIR1_34722 [Plesiocystis pacifica SIR-1]